MFAFLMLIFFLPFLSALFYLWAVVRMWRTDSTLAIVMFLFWPASIYALVRHWGQEENDIRVPLFGSFAVLGLWLGLFALAGKAQKDVEDAPLAQTTAESADEDPVVDQLHFSIALAKTPYRSGQVEIPTAHATIDVPAHFHFYDRASLDALYADSEDGPNEVTVGWLVHESVNLADEDAWYLDVAWIGEGFVAEGDLATRTPEVLLTEGRQVTEQQSAQQEAGSSFSLVRYAETPTLDTPLHRATWVEEYAFKEKNDVQNKLDCHAVKLGRSGAIVYSINEIDTQRQELCLRSVRLASTRTTFAAGQTYEDHSSLLDQRAKFDLVALVTGAIGSKQ
jgi:uncharacterized membrane-anchored protein